MGTPSLRSRPCGGAIGELLTCHYCLAPWVGLSLMGAYALSPSATRLVSGVFGVAAVSDFVNRGYSKLKG